MVFFPITFSGNSKFILGSFAVFLYKELIEVCKPGTIFTPNI